MKRNVSVFAMIIASIAFGMVLTADLGWMKTSHAQQPPSEQTLAQSVPIPSFAPMAERVMPAVVSITTTEVYKESDRQKGGNGINPFDFFFPDPRNNQRQPQDQQDDEHKQLAGGSGFVISPDGYILTNNHVVEGATKVEVHFSSGQIATARIIGTDPATDIALVKVDAGEALPTVKMGDSESIRVGDWAVAIGNPFQFENTLTVGVISAKGRSLGLSEASNSFENFIQTDAAINFGNSGGPLLNASGEAIGINTAIRGGAQNLGFATPINVAKRVLPQLREKGKVTRSYIGVRIKDVDSQLRSAFKLSNLKGAFVESVDTNTPASKAGIQPGDVIVQVDNTPVNTTRDLIDYISYQPPGSKVRLDLVRNGDRKTLMMTTEERTLTTDQGGSQGNKNSPEETPTHSRIGISVDQMSPRYAQSYGIPDNQTGVVVTFVKEVSPAGDANLQEGDVITQVNGKPVNNVTELKRIIEATQSGEYLRFYVTRYGRGGRSQSFFALVQVP
ncbi:MAG: Do family serine endopeptidase [Acidobacteriota bacterium]